MKVKQFLKAALAGIAVGAILFFAWPLVLIVLLLKFIFTPFGMGRMYMYHSWHRFGMHPHMRMAMADKIRNMSAEEYEQLKEKMQRPFHCYQQKP